MKCALTIYKQTILPLFDYTGFMLLSTNISDRNDLQVLENTALRICYNARLRDMVNIELMHTRANLISLDQRRQKQILFLLFIDKNRHDHVRRIHARNTCAADVYSFVRERYHSIKYKNSPYYKGPLLWDKLSVTVKRCINLKEYRNCINRLYRKYNDNLI